MRTISKEAQSSLTGSNVEQGKMISQSHFRGKPFRRLKSRISQLKEQQIHCDCENNVVL